MNKAIIESAVAVQYAAMIPDFMVLEVFPDLEHEPGYLTVLEQPLEALLAGGKMPIPQRAGLGVTLDLAAIEPWHYASCQLD
jgi:L-alanine-DL-glutamate epimerase-like enolase superfamily enzyme